MGSQEHATNEKAAVVDINDYLLDKSPAVYAETANPYQVRLQNSCDFIISRKKGRVERELVILVSEGLFYFKEKDKIDEVTHGRLKTFLRELQGASITMEQVLWMPLLNKDSIIRLMDVVTNPVYLEMALAKVLPSITQYWAANYWEKDSGLFMEVHHAIERLGIESASFHTCMILAFEISNTYGRDSASYFVEVLNKANFEQFSCAFRSYYSHSEMDGFMQLLNEPYNLDLYRLIDYTFVDSYAQGITVIDAGFWQAYKQYLSMQIGVFGEIRDKYPKYLMTACNVLSVNSSFLENIPSDEGFEELMSEVRGLAHEGDIYSIIVPITARQVAEESIALSNCIGSNADLIASGEMQVLFLRFKRDKDKPLVTLQYSRDSILGAEGLYRRELTDDERAFLEGWGKKNQVQIAA